MGEEGRVVHVLIYGEWYAVDFNTLQVGNKFRLYDNGVQFIDTYGNSEWTVRSLPKDNEDGYQFVNVEELTV
jgi:hypothetical protein